MATRTWDDHSAVSSPLVTDELLTKAGSSAEVKRGTITQYVTDALITTTDVTTNNMTTSKHGFQAKGVNDITKFYRSDASQAVTPYTLWGGVNQFNPADATTYFTGRPFSTSLTSTGAQRKIIVPRGGTISRIDINTVLSGTTGSTENSSLYLRLNNTTDTTLSTTYQLNLSAGVGSYLSVSGLSVAVITGDYVEIKLVTATFTTNPTGVFIDYTIYIN